jgi:hypothetical protein
MKTRLGVQMITRISEEDRDRLAKRAAAMGVSSAMLIRFMMKRFFDEQWMAAIPTGDHVRETLGEPNIGAKAKRTERSRNRSRRYADPSSY